MNSGDLIIWIDNTIDDDENNIWVKTNRCQKSTCSIAFYYIYIIIMSMHFLY